MVAGMLAVGIGIANATDIKNVSLVNGPDPSFESGILIKWQAEGR